MRELLFILALFIGTGAVDYMLDSPLAAVIAVGSLATLILTTRRIKE